MHEKIVLQQFLHFDNYMFDNLMCVCVSISFHPKASPV